MSQKLTKIELIKNKKKNYQNLQNAAIAVLGETFKNKNALKRRKGLKSIK